MKTVVATYMVWMKDILRKGPPYPKVNLLLVGNEENGETEKMGTPHVLEILEKEGNAPEIVIADERTGEHGNEVWGEICTQNRGVMRFEVIAHGQRGHSGSSNPAADLTDRLLDARSGISKISESCLTLKSEDGWQTQARFPFIQVGVPGVFNITPAEGRLGVEVLFGLSYLYGRTGETSLEGIGKVLSAATLTTENKTILLLALVFTIVGFGFKVAVVPFHLWAPDAYQGAPTPVTAFIATGSKVASFVVLLKVVVIALPTEALQGAAIWHPLSGELVFRSGWVSLLVAIAALSSRRSGEPGA